MYCEQSTYGIYILVLLMFQTSNADALPGFEMMYIAVFGRTPIVGGSEIGRRFLLESDSHGPFSFVGCVAANSGLILYVLIYRVHRHKRDNSYWHCVRMCGFHL